MPEMITTKKRIFIHTAILTQDFPLFDHQGDVHPIAENVRFCSDDVEMRRVFMYNQDEHPWRFCQIVIFDGKKDDR